MRPVIEDVIGFGSCAEQDSTSQDSATDSGLYPDSEGMSPIPHSDEDKSDKIKFNNRLCPDLSGESVVLPSAQNGSCNTQTTDNIKEFNKCTGLHTEVCDFDDNNSIVNSSCNILNDNLKDHLVPKNGEGQSNHSLLKELLENESEDDFGNFEYACVIPEVLTQPTLLQDLNISNNLIVNEAEDSLCDNICTDSFCDFSNSNIEVCKIDGEQSAEESNSREDTKLNNETSHQDISNTSKEKLECSEVIEDVQVHGDSVDNHVADSKTVYNMHSEYNIEEDSHLDFEDESKQNETISIKPKQETKEYDQESIEPKRKTDEYGQERTGKSQLSCVGIQNEIVNINGDGETTCTEESKRSSQEILAYIDNHESIEAKDIVDINKQMEENNGDNCLYKEQVAGSDTIRDFQTDEGNSKVQDSCTEESDHELEKCVPESIVLSEEVVHVNNLSEDEFDDFQFSSVPHNDISPSLSQSSNKISSIITDSKLWTASEQEESETYKTEISFDCNTEVIPVVTDDGDFQSDEEFSNFADFSASVFDSDKNGVLQGKVSQSEHYAEDDAQVCV